MLECWIGPGATTAISGEGPFPAAWKIESDLPEQTESNRYDEVSREMSLLRQQYHAEFMSIYNKLDLSKDSVPPRLFSLQTSRDSAARIAASRELELLAVSPVSTVWMDRFVSQVQRVSSSTKSQGRDTVLTLYDRLGDGWKRANRPVYCAETLSAESGRNRAMNLPTASCSILPGLCGTWPISAPRANTWYSISGIRPAGPVWRRSPR